MATFSVLLTIFAIKKQLRTSSKPSISLKGYSKRHKRKATIYMNKHHERGIRSDGLWIGVMGENASVSSYEVPFFSSSKLTDSLAYLVT